MATKKKAPAKKPAAKKKAPAKKAAPKAKAKKQDKRLLNPPVTPIKKVLKERKAKADKERAALEKRVKKRGGVVGEAQ